MAEKLTYEVLEKRFEELKTETRQLKQNLHEARQFSEDIMMYMTEGLVLTDTQETVIFINQRLSQILGYKPEQIIGKCWMDVVSEEQQTIARQFVARRVHGQIDRYEIHLRHRDGNTLAVQIGAGPRFDKQSGEFIGTMGVVNDITDRMETENALREKTEFLKTIIDTASDLVSVTDTKGNFQFLGPSHSILGYDLDSLIGRNVMEFVHPDDYPETAAAFTDFLDSGEDGATVEYRYRRADGDYLWFETVGKFIRDTAGNPQKILFSTRDCTQRKHTEGELKRIEWMLSRKPASNIDVQRKDDDQGYGDLTELNHHGIILKSIGQENLKNFANDYLELLGTSSAIYEVNGDYAFGIFSSGWCRMMDAASRKLCQTPDNAEALKSGRWLCHESCWTDCSKEVIAKGSAIDIACSGGIRIYAVPIFANGTVIGAMNFGYGDPPKDPEKLKLLGEAYHLGRHDLLCQARAYDSRPAYIIEMAKRRLNTTAKLIGSMVETTRAMEALQERENQISSIFRSAPVGIGSVVDRVLDKVNDRLCEMIGYDPSELIGQNARMLYPSDEEFEFVGKEKYAQIADQGTGTVETRWQKKDGTSMDVLLSSTPVDLQNHSKGVTFTALDITHRKQAEDVLVKSHEMLKRTESMASIGSWEWDVENDRAHWSEEVFRIFGRDPSTGAPSLAAQSDFYAPGDIQRLKDAVETCVTQGRPYEIELKAIRPDGEIRYCISRGQPQYDESGNVFRLAGSFQDITDRKRSEDHILFLEKRNQALLDHSPVCHKIVDRNFNLQYMSANGFKMLKIDENLAVYGRPYPFSFFPEAFQHEMKEKLKTVMDTGETISMEAAANDFQGNEVWLESSLIPVFDDSDKIDYITVVSADVTHRKYNEKEKARLEGQLRQAQKMEAVGRLAGGVAHDFNNMLNVIIGHASMAMEDVDPSHPIYEGLKEIRRAGERSAGLTRQLLAFARKQTISPRGLNLNRAVENMTRMLHRLIGEDIDLTWLPGQDLWQVKVDPGQIDQILANLCVNARDAIASVGKIIIETGNAAFDAAYCRDHPGFSPGEYVLLAVSDDGYGMAPETLDKIFEPFFTTKESGRGTGLGLATVYGVVKQNKGFINVYSEPGQGTAFKIYLPRYRSNPQTVAEAVDPPPTKSGNETILLVEDEISILNMTAQMLERLGYYVIKAKTPGEAIRLSHEHAGEIHLLVTDVVMPEMNGRDLAKNILSAYPNLKRLFMSGYTANVIAHHGILDEGVNFIQKPFSREQLGEKIREVLDGGDIQSRDS